MADDSLIPASPPPAEFTEETARRSSRSQREILKSGLTNLSFGGKSWLRALSSLRKRLPPRLKISKTVAAIHGAPRVTATSHRDRDGSADRLRGVGHVLRQGTIVLQVLQVVGPLLFVSGVGTSRATPTASPGQRRTRKLNRTRVETRFCKIARHRPMPDAPRPRAEAAAPASPKASTRTAGASPPP